MNDNTYDFIPLPARTYRSFNHASLEAGESSVFGGVHYWPAVAAGQILEKAITKYMHYHISFKKGG